MEGTEAEGLLGEVSRFVRLQTPIEMRVFRQALGNAGQTAESSFWNMLIRQEKEEHYCMLVILSKLSEHVAKCTSCSWAPAGSVKQGHLTPSPLARPIFLVLTI